MYSNGAGHVGLARDAGGGALGGAGLIERPVKVLCETDLLGLRGEFRDLVQRPPNSEVVRERFTALASLLTIAHLFPKREENTFAHPPIDNPWECGQND